MAKKIGVGLILFCLFAAYIYRTSVFRISENFGTVEPGRVYRSAQLTEDELKEVVAKYQIKTIISLRGSPHQTLFYTAEEPTIFKLGVNYEYVGLSDSHFPNKEDIRRVMDIFQTKQYPILIHCRVGADRTGMVSALYERLFMKKSLEESMDQLSFRFWHVRAFHPAMSAFVEEAKDLNWLMTEYDECDPKYIKYRKPSYACK
ncbi:MAG: tyrosine-protein phosphatase [Bdellovibrionaceae bacterium]|nr:tyrosine-protein phosphatase [Pseudobdellovibrionaceae bacterium]